MRIRCKKVLTQLGILLVAMAMPTGLLAQSGSSSGLATITVTSDPAGHQEFIQMPTQMNLTFSFSSISETDLTFTLSGPDPWVDVTGSLSFADTSSETITLFASGSGLIRGSESVSVTFQADFLPSDGMVADYTVTLLAEPLTVVYRVVSDLDSPIEPPRSEEDCSFSLSHSRQVFRFNGGTGSVVATFSNGDPPLALESLQDGRWSGTWQARNASVTQVGITVTAAIPGTTPPVQGTAQIVGGLQPNPDIPQVNEGGVTSNANYFQQVPVAPGDLISIWGTNLAEGTEHTGGIPLETQLADATVILAGRFLPLLHAQEDQLNSMLPYDLAVNTQHQLVVQRGTSYTVPETVTPAQPAIFTKEMTGEGQGVILVVSPSGSRTFAEPATPARAGDPIEVWCAGLGAVDRTAVAGDFAPSNPPAETVKPLPKLMIGGVEADVQFSGLTPDFTGLYQVNAIVPEGVLPGDAVEVILSIAGQTSPPVTMAVQ